MPDDVRQRDLVGQQAVDYERRVDIARLKRERLARLQAEVLPGALRLAVRGVTGTALQ